MKTLISIQTTKSNQKYFTICVVRGKNMHGDFVSIQNYLNREDADSFVDFAHKVYKNLYSSIWVTKQLVWLNF